MHGRKGDLRRKTLCELAGWSEPRFTSARHELKQKMKKEYGAEIVDHIEGSKEHEEQLHERAGWGWFGFFDALLLMLMDDFWRHGGISLWCARQIITNNAWRMNDHWRQIVSGKDDIFIGRVLYAVEEEHGGWLGGPLPEVLKQIEEAKCWGDVSRIVLVNVTGTFKRLRANASKAKIDIPEEFLTDPDFDHEI